MDAKTIKTFQTANTDQEVGTSPVWPDHLLKTVLLPVVDYSNLPVEGISDCITNIFIV